MFDSSPTRLASVILLAGLLLLASCATLPQKLVHDNQASRALAADRISASPMGVLEVSDEDLPLVATALGHDEAKVRLAAIYLAGARPHPTLFPHVIEALCDTDDATRRAAAALVMAWPEGLVEVNPTASPFVAAALIHEDSPVRRAADRLARTMGPAAVPLFLQAVRHSEATVRREAIAAIGTIAPPEDLTVLVTALADPDPAVAELAAQVVRARGQDSFPALVGCIRIPVGPDPSQCLSLLTSGPAELWASQVLVLAAELDASLQEQARGALRDDAMHIESILRSALAGDETGPRAEALRLVAQIDPPAAIRHVAGSLARNTVGSEDELSSLLELASPGSRCAHEPFATLDWDGEPAIGELVAVQDDVVITREGRTNVLGWQAHGGAHLWTAGGASFKAVDALGVLVIDRSSKALRHLGLHDGEEHWQQDELPKDPTIALSPELVVVWGKGRVVGLDRKSGVQRWSHQEDKEPWGGLEVLGDRICAIGSSEVMCRSANDGNPLWSVEVESMAMAMVAFGADQVAIVSKKGVLRSFDGGTGAELWERDLVGRPTALAISGDRVVASVLNKISATDLASGRALWTVSVSADLLEVRPDGIYASATGELSVLERDTGQLRWRWVVPTFRAYYAIDDDIVFVGDLGAVHALDRSTGLLLWTKTMKLRLVKSVQVADGVLFYEAEQSSQGGHDVATALDTRGWFRLLANALVMPGNGSVAHQIRELGASDCPEIRRAVLTARLRGQDPSVADDLAAEANSSSGNMEFAVDALRSTSTGWTRLVPRAQKISVVALDDLMGALDAWHDTERAATLNQWVHAKRNVGWLTEAYGREVKAALRTSNMDSRSASLARAKKHEGRLLELRADLRNASAAERAEGARLMARSDSLRRKVRASYGKISDPSYRAVADDRITRYEAKELLE